MNKNKKLESGFTPIPNEVLEAVAQTRLSDYESRCIHFLWRKTYGWQKMFDTISQTQWASGTGIKRRHVFAVLKRLVGRLIINRKPINSANKTVIQWSFQKDYSLWLSPKQVIKNGGISVTQVSDTLSPKQATEPSPILVHTKEILKENYKESNGPPHKKGAVPDPLNEQRVKLFKELGKRRGYNSPKPGAEAKAMTWMLKQGYSVDQILMAHDILKKEPFWQGKFLNMQSVKTQIGEIAACGYKPKKMSSVGGQEKLPTTEELKESWGEQLV